MVVSFVSLVYVGLLVLYYGASNRAVSVWLWFTLFETLIHAVVYQSFLNLLKQYDLYRSQGYVVVT